ncbi:MAG: Abi-alpha family protein [Haloechinothrix sp.]
MSAQERWRGSDASHAVEAVPGLARVAAAAAWHATGWTVHAYARAGKRLLRAATSPESAATLVRDVQQVARGYARDLVGIGDIDERVRGAVPQTPVTRAVASAVSKTTALGFSRPTGPITNPNGQLRKQGELLLRRSSDVRYEEEAHPAYERILSELSPDEGRILRLLLLGGPQPAVDVRTGGPLGMVKSELIAPGLNMIGARAGCRYVERVPSYLNNLHRLGLVWFSRETLRDPHRYQVIEAQPDVLAAMKSVRFAKVVRRSIHLTPFGEDFCRECLALDIRPGQRLPEHHAPDELSSAPEPPPH